MKELTTTSYAILGLLALRPWSAYELAGQMTRGLGLIWPRAESAMYEEPKHLVALGLARAASQPAGARRSRTVYSITPKGRRALREWLGRPSAPPQFESESHLHVMFAEHGSKEQLLGTLEQYRAYGEELRRTLVAQLASYVDERTPFPERWHLIALGSRFLLGYAALTEEWARWAAAEVRRWPSSRGEDVAGRGEKIFKESIAAFGDRNEEAGPGAAP